MSGGWGLKEPPLRKTIRQPKQCRLLSAKLGTPTTVGLAFYALHYLSANFGSLRMERVSTPICSTFIV